MILTRNRAYQLYSVFPYYFLKSNHRFYPRNFCEKFSLLLLSDVNVNRTTNRANNHVPFILLVLISFVFFKFIPES